MPPHTNRHNNHVLRRHKLCPDAQTHRVLRCHKTGMGVARRGALLKKKGKQASHLTVVIREISLIDPKWRDGDLSLLLDLKDCLSRFCDEVVSQKRDTVTRLSQIYVTACSRGKLSHWGQSYMTVCSTQD